MAKASSSSASASTPINKALTEYLRRERLLLAATLGSKGALDGRLANEMGILTLPTMLLIDKQGKVLSRNVSASGLDGELKQIHSSRRWLPGPRTSRAGEGLKNLPRRAAAAAMGGLRGSSFFSSGVCRNARTRKRYALADASRMVLLPNDDCRLPAIACGQRNFGLGKIAPIVTRGAVLQFLPSTAAKIAARASETGRRSKSRWVVGRVEEVSCAWGDRAQKPGQTRPIGVACFRRSWHRIRIAPQT